MVGFGGTDEGDKCFVLTSFFSKGGCMRKSSEDGDGCADAESLHFFEREKRWPGLEICCWSP